MNYFLLKLIPPRPTFAYDMTETERKLMQAHSAYWRDLADKRTAIVFGPVADPKGPWGVAIVETENEAAARALSVDDPVMKANANFSWEIYPMLTAVTRK
jgi:uncharacterized protein YciI